MEQKVYPTPLGNIQYWVSTAHPEKPWLVFLPGLSADHTLFDKQMEYFCDCCPCLVWDAPAHGASRPFPLDFSMEDLADHLHGILDSEGVAQAVLVGQSLGGYIAQAYITKYPESVRGFVSIDSCSLSRKYYTALELAMLKNTKGMYMSIPWKWLLEWGISGTAVTPYGRDLLRKMWAVYTKEEYCSLADHGMRMLAEAVEARAEYPLPCPVLLLCGDKDNAGSARSYNRRWTKQDSHPLIWLKGAGHNANTDAPDLTNQLISDFLTTLP